MAYDEDGPYIVVERSGGSVTTFLWGAAVGAGLALLFAPRSGREMRQDLSDGARRLKETAEDKVRQVQTAVSDGIDTVRRQVTDRVDAAKGAFDAGRNAARETREEMERRIRETRANYEAAPRSYGDEAPLEEELDVDVHIELEGDEGL